jgi:hypothetical protein
MDYSKPNSNARMSRLTLDQRDSAFLHCETVSIKNGVLWLKTEFNLETSSSALSTWLRRERARRSMADRRQRLLLTKDQARIVGKVFQSATSITVANSVLISEAVFEEMQLDPGLRDQKKLIELMRLALAARDQEIKESALALNIDRFRFNGSKAALKYRKELKEIGESDEDETEKIKKVILLLFGEEPTGIDTPSAPSAPSDKEAV